VTTFYNWLALRRRPHGSSVHRYRRAEKGFDKAITRAGKVVKQTVDATADEIAEQMKQSAES
jgi:hypothetical protein